MLLASLGLVKVTVARRLRGLFLATGDELSLPGVVPGPQQVRSSNSAGATTLLAPWADLETVQALDEPLALAAILEAHLSGQTPVDFILTSGGVSAGKFDWLPRVFAELGVREIFHKVAQRPGKPLWFGQGPQGTAVFGLPGNPVAAMVCTRRYVLPWVRREAEGEWPRYRRARLRAPARSLPRLNWFQPVRCEEGEDGVLLVDPVMVKGSGDFAGLAGTQGCVEIAPGREPDDTSLVSFFGWDGK
jgi:molybdopterin molybdotransferase